MDKKENLLEQRKILKRRKPVFLRTDWHKMSVLGWGRKKKQKWRKASGRHNKIRKKQKGHQKMPSIGYRSPRLVRGSINGKLPIIISNVMELKNIQNEKIVIISSNVGKKKRIDIINEAKKSGIKILNLNAREKK